MKIIKLLSSIAIIGLVCSANAQCTEQQKANMILNNISQATIDSVCNTSVVTKEAKVENEVKIEEEKVVQEKYEEKPFKDKNIDQNDYYIGFGFSLGSGTNEFENKTTRIISEQDFDFSAQDFKFGILLSNDNRFEMTYAMHTFEYDNGGEDEVTSFNFDWLFTYPRGDFAPYWGIGLGFYTLEDSGKYFTSGEDLSGAGVHLMFGGLLSVSDDLDIEAGYKTKSIGWDEIVYPNGSTVEFGTIVSAFYMGVNLKF